PRLHIALGALYLKKRDMAKAEEAFKDAITRDPKSAQPHTALAQFYTIRQDVALAEVEFKAAAELSPNASAARMQLVDFYVRTGRPDAARAVLIDITMKDADALPAWRRLADIALSEARYDDSLK